MGIKKIKFKWYNNDKLLIRKKVNTMDKIYACIDLKSFYASVECVERGLDPLTTNLVVADNTRTEKTICLAVSPSLKQYGISGRARLFEVVQKVKEVNNQRRKNIPNHKFIGSSTDDKKLKNNNRLELDYIVAQPRMAYYMKYSTKIYNIYLKYISSDDIYVYSIDEVFLDLSKYLTYYKTSARNLITRIIQDVYKTTGITATAGIGTNLYLCKIAMDIVAKHITPNEFGVRIATLDEKTYRKLLWTHTPITDFWRVGKGYAKKLADNNIYTMGDIALCSTQNEELLYKLFGVNAELLIDHAWGYEPCTMKDIKKYKPATNSISSGQVLHSPYSFKKAKIIVQEMAESLALDLVDKHLVTNQLVLTVGYDIENLEKSDYTGEITTDHYGRKIPKQAHGTINIDHKTSSTKIIKDKITELYYRIVNKNLLIRRIYVVANNVEKESIAKKEISYEQMNLFSDYNSFNKQKEQEKKFEEEEKKVQSTILDIKRKYGKNAILKGMNLKEESTTIERNNQIGGHKA